MITETFKEFCESTLIVVTTYNRPEVTKVALGLLSKTKQEATLMVVDDASGLKMDDLKKWAPGASIQKLPTNMGIEKLRLTKLLDFTRSLKKFKYIYNTDNDAIHDPLWLGRLYELRQQTSCNILGLFNSPLHVKNNLMNVEGNIAIRSSCPGISMLVSRDLLEAYKDKLEHYSSQETLPTNWDYLLLQLTQQNAAISEISFVEHYGADGIHNVNNTDRALNPTQWLKNKEGFYTSLLSIKGTC